MQNQIHENQENLTPVEIIESKIYFIRGRKVMLDRDLAVLYGVETKVLNQAVKRNLERFPEDFMFELSLNEATGLRSQFVTLNADPQISISRRGKHEKYGHVVFSEMGIAMLSSVLNSKRAIQVNIQIMRTFTKLREILATHDELRLKLEDLERRYSQDYKVVFDTLRQLMAVEAEPKPEIGFRYKEEPGSF